MAAKAARAQAADAPSKDGRKQIDPRDGAERYSGTSKIVTGCQSNDLGNLLINQAYGTVWRGNSPNEDRETELLHSTLGALKGIEPKDEIEGMLAAQMFATHNAAMECFRRAMIEGQTFAGREQNLTQANKLTRSYATLVQALDKHRGKGNQTVRVEHVHVHEGGQAIVGNVSHDGKKGPPQPAVAATPKAIEERLGEEMALLNEDLTREGVEVER